MNDQQGLGRFRPKLISVAVASCFVTSTALANPTGHSVAHGNVTVKEVGNLLKIHNSPNAVINWRSFSIGANEVTRFIQESRNSRVMNRVIGSDGAIDPSVILGTLKSNGRVYLLNPSGVVFGEGATVNVGGLVASSLNLSDTDFLANRLNFTGGAGAGSIVNQGDINTRSGGEVYLVGSAVTNGGVITSPSGDVVLAAGNRVELVNPGTPDLRVEITAPDNQAVNLGNIVAESGRIGIYAGLVNNSGTIRANSAVSQGGKILLKANQNVTLESSSVLDASGVGGGTIEVLAKSGAAKVAGRLDASAPVNGDGGFIETSANKVTVADGTVVTTSAPHGKTGMWLIDPNDFYIAAYGGDMTGAFLASTLNSGSTNVTLTSDAGAYGGSGSIFVNDSVNWSSANGLTLLARGSVFVNEPITNGGTGHINLYAGWNGSSVSAPAVTPDGMGSIQIAAPISTQGNVFLVANNHAHQMNGSAVITANGLLIESGGTSANFDLATNFVNTIAGRAVQGFHFRNGKTLTVGTVGGVSGITVSGQSATVDIDVSGSSVALNVKQDIVANASAYGGSIQLYVNGSYGGDINISNPSKVVALRATGDSGYINLYGRSVKLDNSTVAAEGESANVYLYGYGPDGVEIRNSSVEAKASGGDAYVSIGTGVSGGNALIDASTITAKGRNAFLQAYGGDVTVRSSTMTATGQTGKNGGTSFISIGTGNSDDNVLVDSSKIAATGRTAVAFVAAYGGDVTLTSSAITAAGDGDVEGGSGFIGILAGSIDTGSSSLKATGNNSQPPQSAALAVSEVPIASGNGIGLFALEGDIKLGFLSSNGLVGVQTSGKIIDGNNGANIAAPTAVLFGTGGVGSLTNPLETDVRSLVLDAESGQIGIINLGNLQLAGLAFGSDAAIGTTGTLTLGSAISVPGNLALLANNGMEIRQNVSAGGDLFLDSGGGDMGIHGVSVRGHNVELVGNSIFVGSTAGTTATSVTADHLVKAATALNFNVIGGANSSASSVVRGENVDLTVGGVVNISGGSAYAQIESTSPTTITLTFPNRASGGFFVNGNENVISDGDTGFFAAGQPAVLGEGLKVTYGVTPTNDAVDANVDSIIASINKTSDTNDIGTLTQTDPAAPDEKDGKSLPVCN